MEDPCYMATHYHDKWMREEAHCAMLISKLPKDGSKPIVQDRIYAIREAGFRRQAALSNYLDAAERAVNGQPSNAYAYSKPSGLVQEIRVGDGEYVIVFSTPPKYAHSTTHISARWIVRELRDAIRKHMPKRKMEFANIEICDIYPDEDVCWCDADNLDMRSILNALKGAVIVDDSLRNISLHICGKHGSSRKTVIVVTEIKRV